jgi:cell division protease FtsH
MDIAKRVAAWWRKSSKAKKIALVIGVVIGFQIPTTFLVERYAGRILDAPDIVAAAIEPKAASEKKEEQVKTFSEFMAMAKEQKFKSAVVGPSKVTAETKDGDKVVLNHGSWLYVASFPKDLSELGVDVSFQNTSPSGLSKVFSSLTSFVMQLVMVILFGGIGFVMYMQGRQLITPGWPKIVKDSDVKFADVAGHEEPKLELEELRTFLQNPLAYERVGAKAPRGVLLIGPPGTGKTLFAKALAGEANASFISVSGSDFSNMFIGVGRNRIEKLFRLARQKAPCIIFIDEIDSVARKRGASSSDLSRESDTTLNQLLVEMDGFKAADGVIVVGATNRIDVLDPALLRPGRFDRHITVGLPTLEGRREILEVHVKDRPLSSDVNLVKVARGTAGFSGADLANLVNEAAILAARADNETIDAADFEEARDKVIMGLKRKSLVLDDEERRLIAYHEAGHALIACKMKASDPVHQATIIPRGRALGLVMRLPVKDRVIVRRSKLTADLTVLMGGRAAEEIVFGPEEVSNGAASDIEHATTLVRNMVKQWGLGTKSGMVRIDDDDNSSDIRNEVKAMLEGFYTDAKKILTDERTALDALAEALLDQETIDGDDVRKIVEEAAVVKLAEAS